MSEVISGVSGVLDKVGQGLGRATGFDKFEPQMYGIQRGAFDPNEQEQQLTQALLARAQGRGGPSVAEQQMQQGLEQQVSQAQGMAAAQRGMSPALAARQAQLAAAQAGAQMNQQAGILRAQEAMGAEQLAQQGIQSQRQGRMAREQLASGQNIAGQQLTGQGYEASAGRLAGTLKAGGQALGMMAHGGIVGGYADGGIAGMQAADDAMANSFASMVANQIGQTMAKGIAAAKPETLDTGKALDLSRLKTAFESGQGGYTTAPTQGVGQVLMPSASKGMEVPGKAPIGGDNPDNDIVPAMLSPGEIVIPRSIAKKSPDEIAQFVMALRGGM